MEEKRYIVTKKFLSGLLEGMTVKVETSVEFEVGKLYESPWSANSYIILDVEEAA